MELKKNSPVGSKTELDLRKEIEDFYLPKQLVNAIYQTGGIPQDSMEANIGIGFIDVADYTFLSKFLSPKENQAVLNGLYTAFNSVLRRHGGYLNKIEGDSLMFHYGGITDPNIKGLDDQETLRYIAKELFYTCVEMQRVCALFNQANDKFLQEGADENARATLKKAFDIISTLRNNFELSNAFNALFQIRIRIGANVGLVTVGNFGPEGARQWDIIGFPVIEAKRMESTAPVGGLRISEKFYKLLEETGVADAYYHRFRREAQALFGYYQHITKEELYNFSKVYLKDKNNVEFNTYSIQVNPGLPETIIRQIELLLSKGDAGADKILELLQYYRGNRYIIQAVEDLFKRLGLQIRKEHLMEIMYPAKYRSLLDTYGGDKEKLTVQIDSEYTFFDLLKRLGKYQDIVKKVKHSEPEKPEFSTYEKCMREEETNFKQQFDRYKKAVIARTYFYNVVFPLVFKSIRASIMEYQYRRSEEVAELEAI
ncbi:MAG: adenylate/guanylate cyclase domain-containing protein [Spirochaetia bacterium]